MAPWCPCTCIGQCLGTSPKFKCRDDNSAPFAEPHPAPEMPKALFEEWFKFFCAARCKLCEAGSEVKKNTAGYYSHRANGNYCNNHWLYVRRDEWNAAWAAKLGDVPKALVSDADLKNSDHWLYYSNKVKPMVEELQQWRAWAAKGGSK